MDMDNGYRVILSGIGGDEVLGGVSTPLPELAAYLVTGKWSVDTKSNRMVPGRSKPFDPYALRHN
jgi:asparagine synthetase B (glutamine-hydrolysing)